MIKYWQPMQDYKYFLTESIEKRLRAGKNIPFNFEGRLQRFFYHVTVLPSMECDLLPWEALTISGDGTAVHTHASPRGHHWDSGLDKYYFSYTLFQLSCYNRRLRTNIPLLLRFASAKRHDSVGFLVAFHKLEEHMPAVSIGNMCLDSAMDNYPTYRLLKNREIRAFIGLNDKCDRSKPIPNAITIDKDGTPLCWEDLRMKPNGYDSSGGYLIWRCPYGKGHCSKCRNSCTDSRYGRVVKTRPDWDIRLYTDVPPWHRCL